jgi:hypothetical protein
MLVQEVPVVVELMVIIRKIRRTTIPPRKMTIVLQRV